MRTRPLIALIGLVTVAAWAPTASAGWTATSCIQYYFANPALGDDYGVVDFTRDDGRTRTKTYGDPTKAAAALAKDQTGYGCLVDVIE